jgi:murein DD-endopeptidase MepM/ murein hydrolase activator NlpD
MPISDDDQARRRLLKPLAGGISAKSRGVRHTDAMRRGVWFLVLGVLAAALGAASAYAAGSTTSTTTTTTSTTTTTTTPTTTAATTTTTPAPTYSRLPATYLPAGCVGAGDAAIAEPGRTVLALGTPAYSRGRSAYPTKAPIVRFLSSTASGSACKSARVTLESVSLFGGVVTARSVSATHGKGTVRGFKVYGSPVGLGAGHSVRVGSWGEVTAQKTVGRLTAPLVVQLLAAHHGLPAGTTIAFAFGASPQVVHKHKHKATHHSSTNTTKTSTTQAQGSGKTAHPQKKHHRRQKHAVPQPLTAEPGLGYKPSHYVFPVDGGASYVDTYGANRSDIYDGWHHGDDLFAPLGTPVVAVAKGTLSLVGWNELGGWRVWLTDKKGNSFYYAHLAGYARWILTHHHVRAGQVLGFLGRTGDAFTTTPHLHFEIHPHQPAFVKLGYDGAVDPTTYLQKWHVEHVPAAEIPQPARLKAPVGAPRQEAAVVWRELLVARHIAPPAAKSTAATGSAPAPASATESASASAARHPFPHPPSFEASGAAPLTVAGVRPASAHLSASASNVPLLVGGPLGAAILLAGGAAGAFVFRRRRRAATEPPS